MERSSPCTFLVFLATNQACVSIFNRVSPDSTRFRVLCSAAFAYPATTYGALSRPRPKHPRLSLHSKLKTHAKFGTNTTPEGCSLREQNKPTGLLHRPILHAIHAPATPIRIDQHEANSGSEFYSERPLASTYHQASLIITNKGPT
jgi:hypothetical protein